MKTYSHICKTRLTALLALLSFAVITSPALHAGGMLMCAQKEIGDAKSLPWGNDSRETDPNYNRASLVEDTLALLTPDAPVIVRIETLRRAAIYATRMSRPSTSEDKALAFGLLEKLRERTNDVPEKSHALALFDLGYCMTLLHHIGVSDRKEGYSLLTKAAELRPNDPEIEFALAIASIYEAPNESVEHRQKAQAGAHNNPLLAQNLKSHFGE
jgi:hypothetical protein